MSVLEQESLFADVVQRLRTAAQSDRSFEAAQMQLINLSEIIKQAGPQWPRLKDKIRAGSMSFLKGCLAEADIVIPAGDGFLIIFADDEGVDKTARAEELRNLLLEFYLGEEALRKLGIKVAMRKIDAAEINEMIAPPPQPSAEPTTHSCLFAPMWSARGQAVAAYLCTPVHREDDGPRYGYDKGFAAHAQNTDRDYCELDLGLLDVAQAALGRYQPGEARPAIAVSVHSTTLQHRLARRAYLERLAAFTAEQARSLVVKIAEIETGTPIITMADWAGMMRARAPRILLEFHHSETAPPKLVELGVWGAGFQAPLAASRQDADASPYERQVRKWGESLTRQRLRFFVENLRRPSIVQAAAQAGAAFITSDNFWPYQKWPGPVVSAPAPAAAAPAPGKSA